MYASTLPPYTTSVDSWLTVTGQTAFNGAQDTNRINFNIALRNNMVPYVRGYVDLASVVESSTNSGLWNPQFVHNDGLHENPAGYSTYRNSIVNFFYGATPIPALGNPSSMMFIAGNSPTNGYTLRYTNGTFYWAP